MPNGFEQLETQAIECALAKDWKKAVDLNKQILDLDSQNIPASNRLAKAYLELEKYEDAKRVLKTVLKLDPINQTAIKNLEHAQSHKKVLGNLPHPNLKNFIKEPGTSKEISVPIQTKGLTAKKFYLGEPLELKIDKHKVELNKITGELINILDPQIAEKVILVTKNQGTATASFASGDDKEIKVLIRTSIPVFTTGKQDVKPYIKRDTLEETELELTPPEQEEQ